MSKGIHSASHNVPGLHVCSIPAHAMSTSALMSPNCVSEPKCEEPIAVVVAMSSLSLLWFGTVSALWKRSNAVERCSLIAD